MMKSVLCCCDECRSSSERHFFVCVFVLFVCMYQIVSSDCMSDSPTYAVLLAVPRAHCTSDVFAIALIVAHPNKGSGRVASYSVISILGTEMETPGVLRGGRPSLAASTVHHHRLPNCGQ